jgi:di/tricarboxylate transporter
MAGLNTQETLLLAIIAATLTLIVSGRVRPDLVALLALLALGLSGVLPADQALAGFSRPAVITMLGLFVITDALEETGVVQWLADRLAHLGGDSELRIVAVFMGAGALLSLVMNNIAAGAVLLPAAVQVARRARVPNSRLLMPLGFGTLLGGMATLFTTANIVVSGALQAQGQRALTMLDFLPTGGAIVATGALYVLLVGRKQLPFRESAGRAALATTDLAATYQLAERLWEVRVLPRSPLADRPLSASGFGAELGVTVVAIWHGREANIAPPPTTTIAPNDMLLVLGREERVRQLEDDGVVIGRDGRPNNGALDLSVHLTEVIIGPRAPAIGQTIKALRFRSKFGLTAVALWREGRSYRTDVGDFALQAGDALLMVGPPDRVRAFASEPGYILLDQQPDRPQTPSKGWLAVLITVLVIALSAVGLVPTAEAMLAGAAALIVTGCLSMEDAYRAVEWRVVMLVAGLLPIGTALVQTGVAASMGEAFTATLAPAGPLALVAGLYLFTAIVTQMVGGQVAALIVGPIAVSAAVSLGVNPSAVGVAVAIACSAAFLTPIAHPVNALMMAPGGYTAGDFLRVGAGLSLVCFATLLLAMPLFWSL